MPALSVAVRQNPGAPNPGRLTYLVVYYGHFQWSTKDPSLVLTHSHIMPYNRRIISAATAPQIRSSIHHRPVFGPALTGHRSPSIIHHPSIVPPFFGPALTEVVDVYGAHRAEALRRLHGCLRLGLRRHQRPGPAAGAAGAALRCSGARAENREVLRNIREDIEENRWVIRSYCSMENLTIYGCSMCFMCFMVCPSPKMVHFHDCCRQSNCFGGSK